MGAFTNVEDVKSLFRRLKIQPDTGDEKTNTVVTTEEVDQFIDETEILVKARISSCYILDSIGPESVTILGVVTKYLVADIIKNIMALTVNVNSESKNQDLGPSWGKKAKEMLEKICPEQNCDGCQEKPVMPLPDTPMKDKSPETAALFNSSNNAPTFTKSGNNW